MKRILRGIGWIAIVLLLVAGGAAWWFVYRPLPQVDGTASLSGLKQDVTVTRDQWGVPHVKASSFEDLLEAQGYVMAQDRLWQMDLLRRVARGQLSEIVGPGAIEVDKEFRTLRIGAAADRDVTLLDAEAKSAMEAYARGVNHFIEQNRKKLPIEFKLLKYEPQPWKPGDSLAIAGYMYQSLTMTWESELNRMKVTKLAGAERAKELFSQEAAMDHFVVGGPEEAEGGAQRSQDDSDDPDDDDQMGPDDVLKAQFVPDENEIRNWLQESQHEIRKQLGSNNWVVSGAHTASGKPILANDTHLELTIAPIWYEMHLTAPGWNVQGFTLPGAPLIVIGHNDRVAWGFTNNGADVQDLYEETFHPKNANEYKVHGEWKSAETVNEIIHVKGQADVSFPVVITRHGPIVHREDGKAYAMRWTATEPGALANTYYYLGKAQNWKEFLEIIKKAWGPAQNAVYADVDGNIGYVMGARVPVRKKGHGEVPVPGDTDDYEWLGYVPFEELPQVLNPESGLIVTANARVTGPNFKPYLTDSWEEPYRTARIWELLHDKQDLRPEDMLKVQTDTYSYPHVFVGEQLVSAAKSSTPSDERTKKLVALTKDWNGLAEPDSPTVPFLEGTLRNSLQLLLEPYLGSQTDLYQWRSTAFLQKILTERPDKWLPKKFKSYDELLVFAADQSVHDLEKRTGSSRIEDWPWKRFDSLDMLHPIGREGILKKALSITDKPQAGTRYSPRAATRHHGPSMRFVADLGNWDNSILLIPAGQSGQPGSSHYTDQFLYWYEGKSIFLPFSDAAESKHIKHTLILTAAL